MWKSNGLGHYDHSISIFRLKSSLDSNPKYCNSAELSIQNINCIPSVSVGSPKKVLDLNKCTSSSGGSSTNSNVIVPISSNELTVIWHSSFSSLSNKHCH